MNKMKNFIRYFMIVSCCLIFWVGCAKPLAESKLYKMEPVTKVISADANTIYYGIKWALNQLGYPLGFEDHAGGIIESKWIPVGAGTHFVDLFDRPYYGGTDGSYQKMVIRIVPGAPGGCEVSAQTEVKSVIQGIKSTGDNESAILEKIAEHVRGYDINLTNLGVQE